MVGRREGAVGTLRAVRFDWCSRWVVGCPRSEVMRLEPFGIEGFELVRSGQSNVTLFQNVTLQSFLHTNAYVTLHEHL